MPLVPAKCTQCGSNLEIDSGLDAATCPHCHTAFVTEKAINNYNTYQNTYNQNTYEIHHANIQMNDENSVENRLKSAEVFLDVHKDYGKALKLYKEISIDVSGDYRGWWGVVRANTCNFLDLQLSTYESGKSSFSRVKNVLPPDKRGQIYPMWENYEKRVEAAVYENQRTIDEIMTQSKALKKELEAENSGLRARLNEDRNEAIRAAEKGGRKIVFVSASWFVLGIASVALNRPVGLLFILIAILYVITKFSANAGREERAKRINRKLSDLEKEEIQAVERKLSDEYRRMKALKNNLPEQFYEIKNR